MELIDSHAHLNDDRFNEDWLSVLARAGKEGIVAVIDIGYDLPSCRRALEQAERVPRESTDLFVTVAIHPHHAKEWDDEKAETLRALAHHPKVVAIGECGLDFFHMFSDPATQRKAFLGQLALAWELDLPVVFHIRDAYPQVLEALRYFGKPIRGVVHCFTGTWEEAKAFLDRGFYIGITGIVTFGKKAENVREVAAKVPLERLLVETDAPYLAPMPHRGKRNEPAYLPFIVREIARLKGKTALEVATQTTRNTKVLFNLPERGRGKGD